VRTCWTSLRAPARVWRGNWQDQNPFAGQPDAPPPGRASRAGCPDREVLERSKRRDRLRLSGAGRRAVPCISSALPVRRAVLVGATLEEAGRWSPAELMALGTTALYPPAKARPTTFDLTARYLGSSSAQ